MAASKIQPAASVQPAITEFLRQAGYIIFLTKKQRITQLAKFGEHYQIPADAYEVYFTNFPSDAFEDTFFPLFSQYGKILQMRLMIENDVSLRGYGYVVYENKTCADEAIYKLNGKQLHEWTMRVCMSLNYKRLYITGLPNHYKTRHIESLIFGAVKGVSKLTFFRKKNDDSNSAYSYLTFKSHAQAIKAKNILFHYLSREMKTLVRVSWAKPEFMDTPGKEVKEIYI